VNIPSLVKPRSLAALLAALILPAAAPAATAEQPQPVAFMHIDGQAQKGRVVEVYFVQPADHGLCVGQDGIGDGTAPDPLIVPAGQHRFRFRVNAESRPDASLHYQPTVDEGGHPQGDPAPIPIHVAEHKPNGDWLLVARTDIEGPHYMRLSAFWKGTGRCKGQEFLVANFAVQPLTMSR
jgi:hypothetical protein